jgi:DNA polymerase sigma
LGIFLKFWVKKNKIHGALDKFLSSYALLILIIHYLQSIIDPKILPMLQEVQNIQKEYIYHYEEKELKTNLYFEEDLTQIENYMNIVNDRRENTSSVVELLIGFFDYYAYKYNHYLISISKSYKKPLPEEETIAFPLEDPFDVNYNPGKSMKINTLQFSVFNYCMKKELNNILSGEYFNIGSGE